MATRRKLVFATKQQLKAAYERFLAEDDPAHKNQAGRGLIRSIFGKDSLTEDSIR